MSKLERLLNLTIALLETGRPLTAEEIRTRVPGYPDNLTAFRRSFERDKDDLREMGVPLELVVVSGTDPPVDGYRIPKAQYYLADPDLEPDELAALHLAAASVESGAGIEAVTKLGGRPDVDVGTLSPGALSIPTDPHLAPLFNGVVERRVARFRYHDETRAVEPHRLDYRRGHWYLTGHDRGRGAERNFRIDRIDGDVELGPAADFERPVRREPAGDPAPWELGGGAAVTARLLVDADHALWAVHQLGRESIFDERPDGSIVFSIDVTNPEAFRSFVFSFLEHAEILEPRELRAEMLDSLGEMAS